MLSLPRGDDSIDLVYSVSAIEHTSDPLKAVSEILRVVKPGGHVVLTLDADICGTSWVSWSVLMQIQRLLWNATKAVFPTRQVLPTRLLTFENRTVAPPSTRKLLLKQVLDQAGLRSRQNSAVFAWAGQKL